MMRSFADFLAEKEKSVVLYGIGKRGQTPGKAMAKGSPTKAVKPAKAVTPFSGIAVPGEVLGKPIRKPSGIVGE